MLMLLSSFSVIIIVLLTAKHVETATTVYEILSQCSSSPDGKLVCSIQANVTLAAQEQNGSAASFLSSNVVFQGGLGGHALQFPDGKTPLFSVPENSTLTFRNLILSGLSLSQTRSPGLSVLPSAVSLAPGARLLLHNVSVELSRCPELATQQFNACQLSPSPNFTVLPESLTVHRFSSAAVDLVDVLFTCRGYAPVPCVAATVHSGQQLVDNIANFADMLLQHKQPWLGQSILAPELPLYLYVPHDISFQGLLTPFTGPGGSPSALPEPITPGKLIISGPTDGSSRGSGGPEIDLAGMPYILPVGKMYGHVELRNLTLTNLPYGASRDYPDAMFSIFVWTFDFMRKAFGAKLTRRLSLQSVLMRVASQELAAWMTDALYLPPPAPLDRALCAHTLNTLSPLSGKAVAGAGAAGGPGLLINRTATLGGLMTLDDVLLTDQASDVWPPLPKMCSPDELADPDSYVCSNVGGSGGSLGAVPVLSTAAAATSNIRAGLSCACQPREGHGLPTNGSGSGSPSGSTGSALRVHPLCLLAPVDVAEVTRLRAMRSLVTSLSPRELTTATSVAALAQTPWLPYQRIVLKGSLPLVTGQRLLSGLLAELGDTFLTSQATIQRPSTILGDPFRSVMLDFNHSAAAGFDLSGPSASLTMRDLAFIKLPAAGLPPAPPVAPENGTATTTAGTAAPPPQASDAAGSRDGRSQPVGTAPEAAAAASSVSGGNSWQLSITQGLPAGLANMTSCMWPFFFDRASNPLTSDEGPGLLAPYDADVGDALSMGNGTVSGTESTSIKRGSSSSNDSSITTGGSSGSDGARSDMAHLRLPRAYLESVTVVLQPREVALLAWILATGSTIGVTDPQTAAYMRTALLERSQIAGGAAFRRLLARVADPGWLCRRSGDGGTLAALPVTRLTFARLEWCGVSGRNVTFEAAPAPMDPLQSSASQPPPWWQLPLDCRELLSATAAAAGTPGRPSQGPSAGFSVPRPRLKVGQPPGVTDAACKGADCGVNPASQGAASKKPIATAPVAVGIGAGLAFLGLMAALGVVLWHRAAVRRRRIVTPPVDCEAPGSASARRQKQLGPEGHAAADDAGPSGAGPDGCNGAGGATCGGPWGVRLGARGSATCDGNNCCLEDIAKEAARPGPASRPPLEGDCHREDGGRCAIIASQAMSIEDVKGSHTHLAHSSSTQGSEYHPRGAAQWIAVAAVKDRNADGGLVEGSATDGDGSAMAMVSSSGSYELSAYLPPSPTPGLTQSSDMVSLPPPAELARGLARLYAKVDRLRDGLLLSSSPHHQLEARPSRFMRVQVRQREPEPPSAGSWQSLWAPSAPSASACTEEPPSRLGRPSATSLLGWLPEALGDTGDACADASSGSGGGGGLNGGRAMVGSGGGGGDDAEVAADERVMAGNEHVWGIGGLRVLSELGRGAHGVVFRGLWRELDVAVKSVDFLQRKGARSARGSSASGRRAVREAALSLCCSHRNLVATYTYALQPLASGASGPDSRAPWPPPRSRPAAASALGIPSQMGLESLSGDDFDAAAHDGAGPKPEPKPLAAAWRLVLVQEYCDGNSLRHCLLAAALHLGQDSYSRLPSTRPSACENLAAFAETRDAPRIAGLMQGAAATTGHAAPWEQAHPQLLPLSLPSDPTASAVNGPEAAPSLPADRWEAPGYNDVVSGQLGPSGCGRPQAANVIEPGHVAHASALMGSECLAVPHERATQAGASGSCGEPPLLPSSPPAVQPAPVPLCFALLLGLDIARGMAHLHSCGIVHGDLSSSNVLLSRFKPRRRRSRRRRSLAPVLLSFTSSGSNRGSSGSSSSSRSSSSSGGSSMAEAFCRTSRLGRGDGGARDVRTLSGHAGRPLRVGGGGSDPVSAGGLRQARQGQVNGPVNAASNPNADADTATTSGLWAAQIGQRPSQALAQEDPAATATTVPDANGVAREAPRPDGGTAPGTGWDSRKRRSSSAGALRPEDSVPGDLALDYCREAWGLGFVAKVCDFGLAGQFADPDPDPNEDLTRHPGPAKRSCLYNAPELACQGTCSRATDVYAFAVMLWELALGVPLPEALQVAPHLQHWLSKQLSSSLLLHTGPHEQQQQQQQPSGPQPPAAALGREGLPSRALPSQLLPWPARVPPAYRQLVAECLQEQAHERPTFAEVCGRLEQLLWSLAATDRRMAAVCPGGGDREEVKAEPHPPPGDGEEEGEG